MAEIKCKLCKNYNKIDNEAIYFCLNKITKEFHELCEFHYICNVQIGTANQRNNWEEIDKDKYLKLVAFK